MNAETYDIVIVGYGPTGATLANLIGQAGYRVAVVDMFDDVFELPRAINIDQEVLRTWQSIGLADQIAAGCEPHTGTDFVGADGELIKYLYSAPPPYPLGWPANLMFVQPDAERILRSGVRRFDNVTEILGHEMTSVTQDADEVSVTLQTPAGDTRHLRADWLVGCDGANSPVRKSLGIGQEDLGFSEWWIVVDAWLRKETPLPARTTQYCLPENPGAYVRCSGDLRRWEMKILPGEDVAAYQDQEKIKERMTPYVDPEALEFWRSSAYHFHARVTDRWRDGRILLAGDAAHQMPPFLGQGLCSGVRDAANLSWKLDRVLRGQSSPELLDTYETERKPHIRVLTEITKSLGEIVGETDPIAAAERDRTLREEMNSGRMETVRQNLIPPLTSGFLDPADGSRAVGSLAIQPILGKGGAERRADDLAGPGWKLLIGRRPGAELTALAQKDSVAVLAIGPGLLDDVDGTFAAFRVEHDVESVLVRPDGYIWGAYATPEDTLAAVRRLSGLLNILEAVS
ncbi:hypothetical protein XU06_30310 (plasmid) [Rhodococcus erythropolis]|uniref:bifunctional 3-(3-hydroxy-phenyl)propionate/3-hydroxycinnamic acid hydroxylase MhpA n=1 Tax=Rhodococcus erythropolis TaxID=1833 RepID=UPI00061B64F8|nr:bifunctional 3-(3-hydroxy-phenyl)propionate/3-hydroxycinnamic acid hydroxylase [Rhodococcus erythropolis]AKE01222.1 hypothetical protein XU06_30310 [Rhodococcus erythropolis]